MWTLFAAITAIPALVWILDIYEAHKTANSERAQIKLRAKATKRVNFLRFTKGEEYNFWKNGELLYTDEDDESRNHDTYTFYKEDLDNFEGTDLVSRLILEKIAHQRY